MFFIEEYLGKAKTIMKYLKGLVLTAAIFLFALSIFVKPVEAKVYVRGYVRPSSGTFILPHYRSNPDRSSFNNWSTKGNYNPMTGKKGTVSPSYKFRY